MSKHWKETYSEAKAVAAGVRDFEGARVVGDVNSRWIYYVRVCGFTFTFFSVDMIRQYIDFYKRDVLPTSRAFDSSPFSNGPAAGTGEGQSKFERLPGELRKRSKRTKVVAALENALSEYSEEVV